MNWIALGIYFVITVLAAALNFSVMFLGGRYEWAVSALVLAVISVIVELALTGKEKLRWEWEHLMDLSMAARFKVGARSFTLFALSLFVIAALLAAAFE